MLEMAILGLLLEAPVHGYELRKRLTGLLGAFRAFSYGSLYPALRRMQADGMIVEDDVFLGPQAVFTNDRFPRSRQDWACEGITIRTGATVGAGAATASVHGPCKLESAYACIQVLGPPTGVRVAALALERLGVLGSDERVLVALRPQRRHSDRTNRVFPPARAPTGSLRTT